MINLYHGYIFEFVLRRTYMGLFDLFKKKENKQAALDTKPSVKTTVPEADKKYYQPDEYYSDVIYEGTVFEHRVVTFEERKKTTIPSEHGLYPAEILLLYYCSKGTYPRPKNGYPGFWWFSYGIRDVGAALKSLEERGYIKLESISNSVSSFTVTQLKELLIAHGQPTTGKKTELVERVSKTIPESALVNAGAQPKYALTEIGRVELDDNAYVPYMHRIHSKTIEGNPFGIEFNVWSINKLLGTGDKSNWKEIVDEQECKMNQETAANNEAFMHDLKKMDPAGYRELRMQDQQFASVQNAHAKYQETKNLDGYIAFWETLWSNGGLKFDGAKWLFELPDLYIKAKRYDDALEFVLKLKKQKPTYAYKSDVYIKKIEELKVKYNSRQKKK